MMRDQQSRVPNIMDIFKFDLILKFIKILGKTKDQIQGLEQLDPVIF